MGFCYGKKIWIKQFLSLVLYIEGTYSMVLDRCCLGSAAIYAMFGHRFCYKLQQFEISTHHSLEEK